MSNRSIAWAATGVIVLISADSARSQSQGPDLAICSLDQVIKWGTIDDITAYSVGRSWVNVGDQNVSWVQNTTDHPVLSQNMFRHLDGRFEHIGQSWLKHTVCALQIGGGCADGCNGQGGCLSLLAPGCQNPYSAARSGGQNLMGPKWQVNAATGEFDFPYAQGDQGPVGNTIYKRLQVHNADLALPGASYFVEAMSIAKDDADAGNHFNNASFRQVTISPVTFNVSFIAGESTRFQRAGILAWPEMEPGVKVTPVFVPNDGLVYVGEHATDNGDGTWHYEYAVHNFNADRSIGRLSVPIPEGVRVTNIDFHDVDYHSGDGIEGVTFDGTDWPATLAGGVLTWRTADDFETDPNGNALRWGTLYNFRFDANAPPAQAGVTLGLFKAGTPDEVLVDDIAVPAPAKSSCPADLDGDRQVDAVDLAELLGAWGANPDHPADISGDGVVDAVDLAELLGTWGPCRTAG